MWKIAPWLLAGGLAIAAAGPGAAQPVSAPSPDLHGSLEQQVLQLNRSVQDLVSLLREYLGRQQLDFLFKRVELSLHKIGPLQQELKSLRDRKASDEDELSQLNTVLAGSEALEAQEGTRPADGQDRERAIRKVQFDAHLKLMRSRISQVDQRIGELESELAQEQQNIQHWEATIDQRLGLR
jgi:chromosome segregation ATPase